MTRLDRTPRPRASSRPCRPSSPQRPRGVSTGRRRPHAHHGAQGSAVPPFERHYTKEQLETVRKLLGVYDVPKPTHSKMTFKAIADEAGVKPSVVTGYGLKYDIEPPRFGRPPGPGKKLGQRSPYRRRAQELKALGMSLRKIAAKITDEVRSKAKTADEKEFKISAEAVRQLLDTDGNTGKIE